MMTAAATLDSWKSLLLPRKEETLDAKEKLFSNRELRQMLVPLFIEQILVVGLGMSDTFMVSFLGEAAVSGVALVDQVNLIFLYLCIALGAGGAVIVSQYLGAKNWVSGNAAAGQLVQSATVLSGVLAVVMWLLHRPVLHALFGQVEPAVMDAALLYLEICLFSYPALGIYHAGAAIQRSLGNTRNTMIISALSNGLNILGNFLGLFVFHAGIAGVAVPTVLARWFSALAVTVLNFRHSQPVYYERESLLAFRPRMLRRILGVAVPNAIENGFFQFMKVALVGIVALFGTSQIAANGIAQSIWSLAAMFGVTMGYLYITVIGRCMGAGLIRSASYYFRKLTCWTLRLSLGWNLLVLGLAAVILAWYPLAEETRRLVLQLVLLHNLCNGLFFPCSHSLSCGLRAAGDVKVPMVIAIFGTLCRIALSVVLGVWLQGGVLGVALAMCSDWLIRAVLMIGRWQSGAWKEKQLI